jgi:hypothetical protein
MVANWIRVGVPAMCVLAAGCGGDNGVKIYNGPPAVAIIEPLDGSEYATGNPITFVAQVDDDGPVDELTLQWSSDRDGILADSDIADSEGNVEFVVSSLTAGFHAITLTAIDGEAEIGEASVTVNVVAQEDAPYIEILSPLAGEIGLAGETYSFSALVDDNQDEAEDLEVTLFSDLMGAICEMRPNAFGEAQCMATPVQGAHLLTFEVQDTDGNDSVVSMYFSVLSPDDVDDDGDGWTETQGDCDDNDPGVNPGENEICDGVRNDCDEVLLPDEGTTCWDDDGDCFCEAFGEGASTCAGTVNAACATLPEGDCNDAAPFTYPGAPEIIDGADNDCDTDIDEGTTAYDDDGDGFTEADGDCDDDSAISYPGADERCDFEDNDCDGVVDEENAIGCTSFWADTDNDTYGFGLAHCLCQADATYKVTNNSDCYDLNGAANPANTTWFNTHRGDGSYDYNCDGSQEQQLTIVGDCTFELLPDICDESPAGWDGSVASCGVTANWIWDCAFGWSFSCEKDTISQTQYCR